MTINEMSLFDVEDLEEMPKVRDMTVGPVSNGDMREFARRYHYTGLPGSSAIRRWEALTRLAPAPTEPNKNGNPRLAAAFSEWLMGWPAGHVTDVPGITRNDALRIVGNGVCPQQAAAALRSLLALERLTA